MLRPPSLVVGVHLAGLAAGYEAAADEVLRLADRALGEARLSAASVSTLATVSEDGDARPGIAAAARERGWPLVSYPAGQLPGPANGGGGVAAPARLSVAEAAALAGAAELIVPERWSGDASVAIARIRPRGRLALVGAGPGARDLLTPRATSELRRASVVAGPGDVLEQVADLLRTGTRVIRAEPGEEEARGREAVRRPGWAARPPSSSRPIPGCTRWPPCSRTSPGMKPTWCGSPASSPADARPRRPRRAAPPPADRSG